MDSCLLYLREEAERGPPHPAFNCRLAEALLHAKRQGEALECCRRALPFVADDLELLHICAWVFSNCGCQVEAAAVYRRLIECCPEWADGYRHLSASLAADSRDEEAAGAALQAAALLPDDAEASIQAAEMLMRCDRAGQAAALLRGWSGTPDPHVFRVLSAAEMLRGEYRAALTAVDQAIAGAPDNAEYHAHRGHLLWQCGDISGAAVAIERAASLDPASHTIKRAQLSLLQSAGLASEATAVGGELLHRFPDDKPAAEAVLHLLEHRLGTIDGEYVVLNGAGGRRGPQPPRAAPDFLQRVRNQARVINALIIRDTRTRFADLKLGYAWALIEPILHIALLSVTFSVLMHGEPPIGRHFFIFYYTGLVPYLMFVHTSSGMSHAITGNQPVLRLPPVTTFDVVAARGLLEIITDVVVAALLLAGFAAIGVSAMPDDLWSPLAALTTTAAFGYGVGYVNAVVTLFWRSWEKAYGQVARVLYFISGIFYVPGMMPNWARDVLAWNPVLQAIDWFRAGFFASYQPHWLDRSYLVVLAILALLAGFAIERSLRRRVSAQL